MSNLLIITPAYFIKNIKNDEVICDEILLTQSTISNFSITSLLPLT